MSKTSNPEDILSDFLGKLTVKTVGVAVSGGGDSLALLHMVQKWAADRNVSVVVATVDHGLRPEAAEEAAFVAQACATLGASHDTLHWQGNEAAGNIQARAREARYGLLADWAGSRKVDVVLLGHTRDDVAETFLMRLSRRAGVDGLAAMESVFCRNNQVFARPLLDVSRADLRDYLTDRGVRWVDDPSNEDSQFDRVRARRALEVLAGLGIDAEALGAVSRNMSDAKAALQDQMADLAWTAVSQDRGDLVVQRSALEDAPVEIARRLLIAALQWVSGADYAPRREPLMTLLEGISKGQGGTLHGCLVTIKGETCRITREYAAVREATGQNNQWDARWQIAGPMQSGFSVHALGEEGLRQAPDWRESGLPRSSLLASPSVWQGNTLVAAPLAGYNASWSVELLPERAVFLP